MQVLFILFSGHKSGLVALLQNTHPHIVTVHCLAHRLELAFKDTIKKVPLYEKMMMLLLGLYYLYRKSPKLKMGLKRSFEACQMKMLLPTHVGGTRWLPHLALAIRNFTRGYKAVRSHLVIVPHTPKSWRVGQNLSWFQFAGFCPISTGIFIKRNFQ